MTDYDYYCPYCDYGLYYQGDPLGDEDTTEEECEHCRKIFVITLHTSYSYTTEKKNKEE